MAKTWYTKLRKSKRKEVIANMAYNFKGIDLDDMIYDEHDWVISER